MSITPQEARDLLAAAHRIERRAEAHITDRACAIHYVATGADDVQSVTIRFLLDRPLADLLEARQLQREAWAL